MSQLLFLGYYVRVYKGWEKLPMILEEMYRETFSWREKLELGREVINRKLNKKLTKYN